MLIFRYLFEKISENVTGDESNPVDAFRFQLETRLCDNASGRVRYMQREEVVLPLMIAMDRATNLPEARAASRDCSLGVCRSKHTRRG